MQRQKPNQLTLEKSYRTVDDLFDAARAEAVRHLGAASVRTPVALNIYGLKEAIKNDYKEIATIDACIDEHIEMHSKASRAMKNIQEALDIIRPLLKSKQTPERAVAELGKMVRAYVELCETAEWSKAVFQVRHDKYKEIMRALDVMAKILQEEQNKTLNTGESESAFGMRVVALKLVAKLKSQSEHLEEMFANLTKYFADINSQIAMFYDVFRIMPIAVTTCWPGEKYYIEVENMHAEYAKILAADKLKKSRDADVAASSSQVSSSTTNSAAKEPDANVSQPASTRSTPKVQEAISSSSASAPAAIAFERDAVNTVEAQLEQLMRLFARCDSELAVVLENIKDTQNRNVCVGVVKIIDRSRNEMPANLRDLVALKQEIVSYHAKQNEAKELVVDIERRINYVKMDAARTNRPNNTIAALGELADNYVELQELLAELDDLAVHVEKEFEAKLKDHESMMGRLRMTCERIDAEEKFQPVGEYAQVFMRVSKTMLGLIQEKAKSFADVAAERVALKTKLDGFSLEVKALPRLITDKWTDRVYFQRIARCHPIYAEDPVYGNSLTPQARQRDEVDGGRDSSNLGSSSVAAVSPQSAPRASIANNGRLVQGTLHAATQATSSQNQAQQAHAQAHRDNTRSNKCCIIM